MHWMPARSTEQATKGRGPGTTSLRDPSIKTGGRWAT